VLKRFTFPRLERAHKALVLRAFSAAPRAIHGGS